MRALAKKSSTFRLTRLKRLSWSWIKLGEGCCNFIQKLQQLKKSIHTRKKSTAVLRKCTNKPMKEWKKVIQQNKKTLVFRIRVQCTYKAWVKVDTDLAWFVNIKEPKYFWRFMLIPYAFLIFLISFIILSVYSVKLNFCKLEEKTKYSGLW